MSDIEDDTTGTMQKIANMVHDKIGNEWGFMVLVFPWSDNPNRAAHYVSNGSRSDMVKVLREKADALEAGLDIIGTGGTDGKE